MNSAQQIFQELYALGALFPVYFGMIASAIGLASLVNSQLVLRLGMRFLVRNALIVIVVLSVAALGVTITLSQQLPLWGFMVYLMTTFFCVGILFGNMNALAMEPLGQIAGIGAAVVGALSTLISTLLGTLVGQSYNGTILPLVIGLAVLSALSLIVVRWTENESTL